MDCKEITWILFCVIWIVCCFVPSSEAYDDNLFSDSLIIFKETNETIQARMAAFGPRLGENGIQGIVIPMVKVNSKHRYGCNKVNMDEIATKAKETYNVSIYDTDGYIAMVERGGGCSFSDKVRNMQNSGAKAVIVGNNQGDIHLVTMYASGDVSDIQIPSVFILQYDMFLLEHDAPFDEISMIEGDSDWPVTDIFMMTTLLPIIFIFGIYIIYKFRTDSFDLDMQTESNVTLGAATQEEVDALPIKVFNMKKKKENDPETCAVCIDDFQDGDKLRVLPCHHEYHVECIDLWLTTRKRFCPICKRTINGEDEEADENTPLLGRNNSNTYNTDDRNSSDSDLSSHDGNHIIDIDPELGEEEGEQHHPEPEPQNESEHEQEPNNDDDYPTPQEEALIQPNDGSNDDDDNEPLINLVTRS